MWRVRERECDYGRPGFPLTRLEGCPTPKSARRCYRSLSRRLGRLNQVRFRFQVERTIKDVAAGTADVDTLADSAACGYPFERGVKYLVYASRGADAFDVSLCSHTGPLAGRNDDLALLTEVAAGRPIQPRLFGNVYRYSSTSTVSSCTTETRQVSGGADSCERRRQVREQRTDRGGRFTIAGLTPGRYLVETELPEPYEPVLSHCSAEGHSGTEIQSVL